MEKWIRITSRALRFACKCVGLEDRQSDLRAGFLSDWKITNPTYGSQERLGECRSV